MERGVGAPLACTLSAHSPHFGGPPAVIPSTRRASTSPSSRGHPCRDSEESGLEAARGKIFRGYPPSRPI